PTSTPFASPGLATSSPACLRSLGALSRSPYDFSGRGRVPDFHVRLYHEAIMHRRRITAEALELRQDLTDDEIIGLLAPFLAVVLPEEVLRRRGEQAARIAELLEGDEGDRETREDLVTAVLSLLPRIL